MTKAQFERLVENVKIDGKLTGAVTVYQPRPDAAVEILSGHHRVEAAIAAGVTLVDCVVITSELSDERKTAIQLSHNAINGQDDLAILGEMYLGLDLDAKRFSGLDDDLVSSFAKVDLSGLSGGAIKYQDLTFHFLPEDVTELEAFLDDLKLRSSVRNHACALSTFSEAFDLIVRTKRSLSIFNSATAFATMVHLAKERLAQIEDEQAKAAEASKETDEAESKQ